MMGYNDTGDFSFPDSFNSRRPRPLTFTHHLGAMAGEQSRREQQVVVSSRWNPTPEQLQMLEELYRRGTRTPSADQIQHITAQLRRYGRIEGKNVFYWFQNHKARERQKRRRQLESAQAGRTLNCMPNSAGTKESAPAAAAGANMMRTRIEVDAQQTKNRSPSHTSLTPEINKSAKMGTKIVNSRVIGLVEMEGGREKLERREPEQNDTWRHQMSPPPTHHHHRRFIPEATNIPTAASSSSSSTSSTAKLLPSGRHRTLNLFSDPPEAKSSGFQTLQLFPLRDGDQSGNGMEEDGKDPAFMAAASMDDSNSHVVNAAPHHYQFFEFLPLKNY